MDLDPDLERGTRSSVVGPLPLPIPHPCQPARLRPHPGGCFPGRACRFVQNRLAFYTQVYTQTKSDSTLFGRISVSLSHGKNRNGVTHGVRQKAHRLDRPPDETIAATSGE